MSVPRGDRDKGTPAVEWFLPVIGLFLALALAFGIGIITGRDLNNAKQERYERYRYAADDPAEAQAALADASASIEYRQPCRDPHGHDESDLCAQWKAARAAETGALWTERSFWIGIAGIVVTGVGTWLLLQTIQQGGRALEIAAAGNELTREAIELEFRPIIVLNQFIVKDNGSWVLVTPIWHNIGNVPAMTRVSRSRRMYMTGNPTSYDIELTRQSTGNSGRVGQFIGKGDAFEGASISIVKDQLGMSKLQHPVEGFGHFRCDYMASCVFTLVYATAIGTAKREWDTEFTSGVIIRFDENGVALSDGVNFAEPTDMPTQRIN